MQGCAPGKDAQKRIREKAKDYIYRIFQNLGTDWGDKLVFGFRGYIHGLADAGVIPRSTEVNITRLCFEELKRRRAVVCVDQNLVDGFIALESGALTCLDALIEIAISEE